VHYKRPINLPVLVLSLLVACSCFGDIGVISSERSEEAPSTDSDPAKRPVVLDTRGGYAALFEGICRQRITLEFDTLRGADHASFTGAIPARGRYKTAPRPCRSGRGSVTSCRHGCERNFQNDEILSATMVANVLEKVGVKDVKIVDRGLAGWKAAGFVSTQDYFGNPSGHLPGIRQSQGRTGGR